jgi:hexosaminidase
MKYLLSFLLVFSFVYVQSQPCTLVPKPAKITYSEGAFTLKPNTVIYTDKASEQVARQLQKMLEPATGYFLEVRKGSKNSNAICLKIDKKLSTLGEEGYTLKSDKNMIQVSAASSKGIFYGIQTLRQLFPASIYKNLPVSGVEWTVPAVSVEDKPRMSWRAMMLDVSRQFYDIAYLKTYIDYLAMHKINVFHLHLSDDEGWRLEIKKHPELTGTGGYIQAKNKQSLMAKKLMSICREPDGFYTQEEMKDLIRYADAQNITILPEIDVPGHSYAAAVAIPDILCASTDTTSSAQGNKQNVWCAGREENFQLIDDIVAEVSELFPSAYIHIGGDEVNMSSWSHCSRCQKLMQQKGFSAVENIQNYFIKRLEDIVTRHGKKLIGWNEILEGGLLNKGTTVMSWIGTQPGLEAARLGNKVIMTPGPYLYFDMKQDKLDPLGHWWAGIVDTQKVYSYDPLGGAELDSIQIKNIIGVQACLWSEFLDRPNRTDFQTYPRLCALAEVGWTPQKQREWTEFNNRLGKFHYQRLACAGIKLRVPTPKATFENDKVSITPPFEGAEVRYSTDGSNPTYTSNLYTAPFSIDSVSKLRTCTFISPQVFSPVSVGEANPKQVGLWNTINCNDTLCRIEIDLTGKINHPEKCVVGFRRLSGTSGFKVKAIRLFENNLLKWESLKPVIIKESYSGTGLAFKIAGFVPANKYMLKIDYASEGLHGNTGEVLLGY